MASFPDYYSILAVNETATPAEIKTAYKRKSLISHPDRVPVGPGSELKKKAATIEFQAIADAYFTLSDPSRRRAYDRLRSSQPSASRTSNASSSSSYFDFFSKQAPGASDDDEHDVRPEAEHVFTSVFEDLLQPEVQRVMPFWTWTGAVAGAAIGFIVGNIPGAAIGGYGGSKIGAIRDAKGKAVYEVFKELPATQKSEVLKALALKVFGMTGIPGSG